MSGALARLAGATDDPQAVAAATEAAWWITTADAAMSRHHLAAYGRALAATDPAERRAIEKSLTGLRYVRGQLGYHADPADFVQERRDTGPPGCPGEAARTAADREQVIDARYVEIEELAGREILLQAPVASGLRFLLTVLRVVPELERSHEPPSISHKSSVRLGSQAKQRRSEDHR